VLAPNLLAAYMRTFYGYGAWTAKYWFIGMEEGGGDSLEEIERRITVWHDRGQRDLEDLRDYHLAIGVPQYFGARPKLQRTWRALMRVVLTADHARVDPHALRAYQRNLLGRLPASLNAGTALIERLPLPAPGKTAPWLYGQSGIAALRTRAEYEAALGRPRTQAILDAMDHFQPRAVVTYGNAPAWRATFHVNRPLNAKAWVTCRGRTTVICTHHPEGARSNGHWDEIGRFIAGFAGTGDWTLRVRCLRGRELPGSSTRRRGRPASSPLRRGRRSVAL
jgi:hypothetical protein